MWLHIPGSTQSQSVAALEDSTEPSTECFQRLASLCTVSGKSAPLRSWRLAWKRKTWIRRLSGATLNPSQAQSAAITFAKQLAAEESSRCLVARRARIFPWRESDCKVKESETCSPQLCEPSSTTSPASCSLRTSLGVASTCPKGSSLFCTGLGTECQDRFCWKRQPSERVKNESGCLSWPTVMTPNGGRIGPRTEEGREGKDSGIAFVSAAWTWPSVRSHEVGAYQNQTDGTTQPTLTGASENWAAPRSSMADNGNDEGSAKRLLQGQNPGLKSDASAWCSPAAGGGGSVSRGKDRIEEPLLAGRAAKWATPNIPNRGTEKTEDKRPGSGAEDLQTQTARFSEPSPLAPDLDLTALWIKFSRLSKPERTTQAIVFLRNLRNGRSGNAYSKSDPTLPRRRLNVAFVEWLQNFPEDWTKTLAAPTSCED